MTCFELHWIASGSMHVFSLIGVCLLCIEGSRLCFCFLSVGCWSPQARAFQSCTRPGSASINYAALVTYAIVRAAAASIQLPLMYWAWSMFIYELMLACLNHLIKRNVSEERALLDPIEHPILGQSVIFDWVAASTENHWEYQRIIVFVHWGCIAGITASSLWLSQPYRIIIVIVYVPPPTLILNERTAMWEDGMTYHFDKCQ